MNIVRNMWASGTKAVVITLVLVVCALSACTQQKDYRGYRLQPGDLKKLEIGMAKSEVEAILGSPSTTAAVNFTGDSFYYISSTVETTAFFHPTEIDRKVLAIRFNKFDQVESFAQYGLEDGQIVNYSDRETPTRGRELSILQQIFVNLGNVSPTLPTP